MQDSNSDPLHCGTILKDYLITRGVNSAFISLVKDPIVALLKYGEIKEQEVVEINNGDTCIEIFINEDRFQVRIWLWNTYILYSDPNCLEEIFKIVNKTL